MTTKAARRDPSRSLAATTVYGRIFTSRLSNSLELSSTSNLQPPTSFFLPHLPSLISILTVSSSRVHNLRAHHHDSSHPHFLFTRERDLNFEVSALRNQTQTSSSPVDPVSSTKASQRDASLSSSTSHRFLILSFAGCSVASIPPSVCSDLQLYLQPLPCSRRRAFIDLRSFRQNGLRRVPLVIQVSLFSSHHPLAIHPLTWKGSRAFRSRTRFVATSASNGSPTVCTPTSSSMILDVASVRSGVWIAPSTSMSSAV